MPAPDGSSLVRAEMHVTGRVQGVGYRDFARRCAERAGVVGYAMNLGDGSVQVVAEGARVALEALVRELERGPRLARVERVEVVWREACEQFTGFGIRYGDGDR